MRLVLILMIFASTSSLAQQDSVSHTNVNPITIDSSMVLAGGELIEYSKKMRGAMRFSMLSILSGAISLMDDDIILPAVYISAITGLAAFVHFLSAQKHIGRAGEHFKRDRNKNNR